MFAKASTLFKAVSLLIFATILLSACAPAATTAPTNPAQPTQPPAQPNQPQPTQPPAPAQVSGELRVGLWGSPEDIDTQSAALDAYSKQNPNVKITYEAVPGDFNAGYLNAITGGVPYDVMVPGSWMVQGFAAKDVLLDLTPMMARDGIKTDDYFSSALQALQYKGEQYAIPMGFHVEVVYYNKALFDKAGVAYPDPSWTWDDAVATAKKLTVTDASGKTTQWGIDLWETANAWSAYLSANNTFYMTQDGKCNLSDPAVKAVFQKFYDIIWKDKVQPRPADLAEVARDQMFLQENLAMISAAHWMAIRIAQDAPDMKYDIVPLPQSGPERASIMNVHGWGIYKNSKNIEAAWDLVKFLSTKWEKPEMGLIPAFKSVANGPAFLQDPREPAGVKYFFESASWPKTTFTPSDPSAGAWFATNMAPGLDAYIGQTLTWDEVISQTCAKAEEEYKPIQ